MFGKFIEAWLRYKRNLNKNIKRIKGDLAYTKQQEKQFFYADLALIVAERMEEKHEELSKDYNTKIAIEEKNEI